jgi:hypothetical protein
MDRQIKNSLILRRLVLSLLAVSTLATSQGHADILDLPDPGNPDSSYLPPTPLPSEVPPVKKPESPPAKKPEVPVIKKPDVPAVQPPTQAVENEKIGKLEIKGLSRKTGGSVYTIQLQKALSLKSLDLEVKASPIKLIAVTLITDDGQKVQAADFSKNTILEIGAKISTALNQSDRVKAIQLKVESMGGNANVLVSTIGDRETPKLKLKVEAPPTPPTPPAPSFSTPQYQPDNTPDIRTGDEVLYGDYPGKVLAINPQNRTATFRFDLYETSLTVGLVTLSKRVNCLGQICTGDQVTYGEYTGKVLRLYANGKGLFRFDLYGTTAPVNVRSLAKATQCIDSICVGDSVLLGNYTGRVQAIFNNRMASVRFDATNSLAQISTRNLAKEVACVRSICSRDRVLLGSYAGKVKKVFSNEQVQVIFDATNSESLISARSLAKSVDCHGRICVGDRVRLSSYNGRVVEVFNNGQAQVRFDTNSSEILVVSVSSLTK